MHLFPGFIMSTDAECLTALPLASSPSDRVSALNELLAELAKLVPCLPGPSGIFTGYGRVYIDGGHIELAAAECASPYEVPVMLEKLQCLVAKAARRLRERGIDILLATCTHGGRLMPGIPSWGAHENYLVGTPAERLVDRGLPFLITRVFAGAGAIWAPTGEFLAGARLTSITTDTGGGTSDHRALFSTARQEHHAGGRSGYFRCHLILGDGHRSQFSQALHFGSTALVLRAIEAYPERVAPIPRRSGSDQARYWLAAARELNRLAMPGQPLRAHPVALNTQRFYLDLASDFVAGLDQRPPWTDRLIRDWSESLDRIQEGDDDWLGSRLDPWIKHRLFSAWLEERGVGWNDVTKRADLLDGLALLDQDYHEFTSLDNVFDRLDHAGWLRHRVERRGNPGDEVLPFVPEVATRAKARARFIKEWSGKPGLAMDWSVVVDRTSRRRCRLDDPFALSYMPWESFVDS